MNRYFRLNAMSRWLLAAPLVFAFAASMLAAPLQAAPLVQCRVSSSGEALQPEFKPVSNPLSTSAIDTSNGFRFSGILLSDPLKFKSYVYYESKDRQVLIARHETDLSKELCGMSLGRAEAYAPYLENHLAFSCTYLCAE